MVFWDVFIISLTACIFTEIFGFLDTRDLPGSVKPMTVCKRWVKTPFTILESAGNIFAQAADRHWKSNWTKIYIFKI